MNINSAPGPDGFGPAWYAAAWGEIKADIMAFLQAFFDGCIELARVNRAHIVLLPKTTGATDPRISDLYHCKIVQ